MFLIGNFAIMFKEVKDDVMYLKKIIAHGFKSFADNTVIDFENNIAGIVGPNGSGKSNIVDAIRWVLGEQSIKSLRGDTMTDVIFAGSKSRGEMNVASVTLLFDNSDNYIPIGFDEVSIKRRLYKDGTNEYFINNEKVRLKDVNNILVDSGIAKESFNIISQGKIEEIISSKPESRRVIFEEAAGVIKYKKRKEEALRKLERTKANMDRVCDIINELEHQIEPLKVEKEKALEYQDIKENLKKLEISLIASDINNINDIYQKDKEKIDELNKEITLITTNNSSFEANLMNIKLEITKCDDLIKKYQSNLLVITEKVEQINSQKNIILERQKYQVDDYKLHNNIVALKEEELKLKNEIDNIIRLIKGKQEDLEVIENKGKEVLKEYNDLKSKKEKSINDLNKQLRLDNKIKNEIELLKERIDNHDNLPYAVKKVLDNPKLRGIHNTIGNIIEVDEAYSKAISVALGSSVSNVIVDNEICAKEAINYLKEAKQGRVTFYPLNIIKEKYLNKDMLNLINIEGFVDIACNLVKYDSKYSNIVKNLLGNIIVVNNIDTANRLAKLINFNYRIVTMDGEILHVGGSLTGGNISSKNIILEKYELERKIKEQKDYINTIQKIEDDINIIDSNLAAFEDKIYLLNKDKNLLVDEIKNKNNQATEITNKIKNIQNDINGTNNILNNNLSKEEDLIISKYYEAVNKKNEVINEIDKLNKAKAALTEELERLEHLIKKDNSLFNEKSNILKNLEIEVNRYDVKLDTLLNTLSEEYAMTYEKALSMYKLEINEKEARSKVSSLKKTIKNLGVVNTGAIAEYDRISERYEFLLNQQNDLSNAENTLLDIIKEMDQVMTREFIHTFNIIEKNFEETFSELFKGGYAKLELTNKDDILNTGIDIVACPPGKTLKNINLLSGGEKTFTAISLLFAILKSRIIPFCVLDEIEAALDEVNVDAFGQYLLKLKEKTQFIVITHKKKTMEYANILYGITMQESGISKLVSVKLENIEDKK